MNHLGSNNKCTPLILTGLSSIKQVRVVGALSQLHEDVLQPHLLHFSCAIHDVDVLHQNLGVPIALHLGQPDKDGDFLLGLERLLDIDLEASKQERLEHSVQALHQGVVAQARVCAEPLVEVFGAGEDLWQKEVEQRPELVEVILQRRAGQQEPE